MRGRVGMSLGAVGLLTVGLVLTMGARQDEPTLSVSEIHKEQAKLAHEALAVLKSETEHGLRPVGGPEHATWSRRLVQAERDAGDDAAYHQALEDHLALMKKNLEIAEGKFHAARGRMSEVLNAKYALNEAKLWLAQDQNKAKP